MGPKHGFLASRDAGAAPRPLRHVRDAFDHSVAVVLGVNAYRHGIPRLSTAVPDAEAIAELLAARHGYSAMLRRDGEVTAPGVRGLFERDITRRLGRPLTERDRLVVYFAGHGVSLPGPRGPEGWLLLADAEPANRDSLFAMAELRRLISALPCRHVLVVLDCCFAGTFRWAGRQDGYRGWTPTFRETLDRFVQHRAWQVLVSASHDQVAADVHAVERSDDSRGVAALRAQRIETGSHSPFARALIHGICGGADYNGDGLITASELALCVRDVVERETRVQQTPQLYLLDEHDRGEFVFQVPETALALETAPALAIMACPYQGLRPYSAGEHGRFFGRTRVIDALVSRVRERVLTIVLGASGAGKSSLVAAGVVPVLRSLPGWTVVETRADVAAGRALRDAVEVPDHGREPGATLCARIAAWLSAYPGQTLCLAIDHAESITMLADRGERERTLNDLAQAVAAHGSRLRIVLVLRSEFESVFRSSALAPLWPASAFVVPALEHHELREIIERPALGMELSFEPPALVDALINDVLQAPGGLPLLSFVLRELYVRCAERNRDRWLTEADYADMGRLSGALAGRASQLLADLAAGDPAYEATARRVFLRMVASRDDDYVRRRAHRDELVFDDAAENQRVGRLLTAFRDARLIVFDKQAWEPAHDWLVRGWPMFSMWRVEFGARAFALQLELSDAAERWQRERRAALLWTDDPRLAEAQTAMRAPASWLNARERSFVTASAARRRRRVAAVVAAAVIAALAGVAVWDAYYRTHVDYYMNYVLRWGAPEGIDPVTERERRSSQVVKLVRTGHLGHVSHVEIVDGAGKVSCESSDDGDAPSRLAIRRTGALERSGGRADGGDAILTGSLELTGQSEPCQWDFIYAAGTGAVSTEVARDRNGRVVYQLQYLGASRDHEKATVLDQDGNEAQINDGNAERIEFIRSPDGLDVEHRYALRNGAPARNHHGVSIERTEFDRSGRVAWVRFFDETGAPMRNSDDIAGWRITRDGRGDAIALLYVDDHDRPARSRDGIAGWRSVFDDRRRETARTFVDEGNQPVRGSEGIAGWRAAFDERGYLVEMIHLDEAGKPTRNRYGIAGGRPRFDDRGDEIESVYLDEAGKPVRDSFGVAGERHRFDDQNNLLETEFFDELGRPIRNRAAIAGWRCRRDDRGNVSELTYFDTHGRPTLDRSGIAGYRPRFDHRGNLTEAIYLDESGRPTRDNTGIAGYRRRFDERGNPIELAFLDEAGRPTRDPYGVAGTRSRFDDRGNEIERVMIDDAGKPMPSSSGLVIGRWTYDARGNQIEASFFDEAGHPSRGRIGNAGERSKFDARGRLIEHTFVDEAGDPAPGSDGFATSRATFDDRNNPITIAFFDAAGRPARDRSGAAGYRSTYDDRGNETERTYLGPTGTPVATQDGFASYRAMFDDRGNETQRLLFDENGKPARIADSAAVGRRSTFDDRGNEIEQTWIDGEGRPTRGGDGYAQMRTRFDARDRPTQVALFDEQGKPVRNRDGVAGWWSIFDAAGRCVDRTMLDEAGKPVRNKQGVATYRSTFDARGREIEVAILDEAGHPTRASDGTAGVHRTFDERGNLIGVAFFDPAGHATRYRNGYAAYRMAYDPRSDTTEYTFLDVDGKVIDKGAFDRAGKRLAAVRTAAAK